MKEYGKPNRISSTLANERQDVLLYRPKMNKITGSVTATILLKQAMYWAEIQGNDFYKFIQPCKHEKYKKGDSWTEELGFTKHEFRTAIKKIGYKRGRSNNKIEKEENAYIIYYTTNQRITYWIVNWDKLNNDLNKLYSPTRQLLPNSGNTKVNTESGNTKVNTDNGNTITSENTSESTTKNTKQEDKLNTYQQYSFNEVRDYIDNTTIDLTDKQIKKLLRINNNEKIIIQAIQQTVNKNKPSSYIKSCLRDWEDKNLNSEEQVRRYIMNHYKEKEYKENDNLISMKNYG